MGLLVQICSQKNLLESSGVDVKQSRPEGTKLSFDEEMDSGIIGPVVTSRPDEGKSTALTQGEIQTVPPPALSPEKARA